MSDDVFDEGSVVECASGEICKTLTAMELVRRKCLRGIMDECGGYCEQYDATGKGDQPQRLTLMRSLIRHDMEYEILTKGNFRSYRAPSKTPRTSSTGLRSARKGTKSVSSVS